MREKPTLDDLLTAAAGRKFIDAMVCLYAKGLSLKNIAASLGSPPEFVRWCLTGRGVEIRSTKKYMPNYIQIFLAKRRIRRGWTGGGPRKGKDCFGAILSRPTMEELAGPVFDEPRSF